MDANRLAEEYAKLGSIYDPQATLIQKQISELPGQYEAQKTALEQAKANAFRDISTAAQARGAFFSGFRPEQMGRYTGEKYLPALASLSSQQQQRQAQLESALQQTQAQRQREATVNLQNIMKLEAAQKAAEAQIAAARAPRYVSGGGGGGGGRTTTSAGGGGGGAYYLPSQSGGYNFFNEAGKPISAYEYSKNTGTPMYGLLSASNDPGDRKIAADIASGVPISQLRSKYPWAFGS